MFIGSLAGFVLPLFRPTLSVLVALVAVFATTVFAVWTMWHSFAWFSWMTIVGVQLPAALGWSVLAHTNVFTRKGNCRKNSLRPRPLARRTRPSSCLFARRP